MVSQITPQQTLAPPQPIYQPIYQNYSPELTAALAVLERAYQQQNQQQASPQSSPSQVRTSQQSAGGYGGSGAMMGSIDPAVLLAQWQALQTQNLPQTAIPVVNNPVNPVLQQYQQAAGLAQQVPQQVPQQTTVNGDFLTQSQIDALANFIQAANNTSVAAENYIRFLESEYSKLRDFSNEQHNLIERFLYDREFTLEYIRGAWIQESIDNELANAIATVYMEIDRLFPRHQHQQPPIQNPAYTGGNVRMNAQIVDTAAPTPYVSIPALPNGSASVDPGSITVEQYFAARDSGNMREAVMAAYRDPTALYAAMYR